MISLAGLESPYKGLVSYSEDDAQFFFGRKAEREIIKANLFASRLTLLYGPSGVGKSSVLRAGVVHHLRTLTAQHLRAQRPVKFIVVIFNSWRDNPIKGLTDCIHDAIVKTFKDRSHEIPLPQSSLTETLLAWAKTSDLLIILDQFEEYFLYHPLEEDNSFDTEFPRAVNHSGLRANFLISMREDGLSKLDRFKGRIPNIFSNYLRLEHLGFDAARDAIEKPIEQYNHVHPHKPPISIEPRLVDEVLKQVKTGHLLLGETGRGTIKESNAKAQVETPYLQLVMVRLWQEELSQASHTLQFETLQRLNGAQSIVSNHLDRVMRSLSKKDRITATDFFQYLITPSGSKIAYPVTDLIKHSKRSEKEVENILKTLEDERVLRQIPSSIDDPDTVRYEIFHDVLAIAILDWRSRFLEDQKISAQVISITGQTSIGYTAEQVSTLITQILSTFQPKPFDGRSPYKGLDYFEEDDAEFFFGRERLVADLINRVKETRTVFVTGPSGSGKSSLVRAGLIHALKQGAISGSEYWLYATIKPGREPIQTLARALASLVMSADAEDEIRTRAMTDESVFARWCEIALRDKRDKRVVLFIDQFEEVFTQINKEEERLAFLNLLVHAASAENGPVLLLFALRSDFVSNCAAYPRLNALLNQPSAFAQIGAMQPEELVNAIAQPALRVGLRIDSDLVAQIINDMEGESGALPLMQFALKDLFDSQQAQGSIIALTLSDYLQRGGIRKALARHADDTFNKLDSHEQELARSIFSGLIEIGRGTQDTRRTATFDELVPASVNAEEVAAVVQKLADARLITTDEIAGKHTVIISHEKLIDAWPWLKMLVNENRDVIALQNEVAEDAKEWDEHQRDESYLYTGSRLVNVGEKLSQKKLVLGGLSQMFIEAGSQAYIDELEAARLRARTLRRAGLVTSGMLVIALILVGLLSYNPVRNAILRQRAMGPALIHIPTSEVVLGDSRYSIGDPVFLPRGKYFVEAFNIEPYEVTNQRYLLCIEAGACTPPIDARSAYTSLLNAQLPVVNITAIQASQFCKWLGRRLPTDFEWERAARGKDGRLWPWGNLTPSSTLANFSYQSESTLQPVGKFVEGKSPEGIYDLAGNVWEWTSSEYRDPANRIWNLDSLAASDTLSARGGSYNTNYNAIDATIAFRDAAVPFTVDNSIGFRCASN